MTIISTEDRLRAENLQLRLENIQGKLKSIQNEIQHTLEGRDNVLKDMNKLREEFQSKYNVDLAKVAIMPDGTVKDVPQQSQPNLPGVS